MQEQNINIGSQLDKVLSMVLENQETIKKQNELILQQLSVGTGFQPEALESIRIDKLVEANKKTPIVEEGEVWFSEKMDIDDDGFPCIPKSELTKNSSCYKIVVNNQEAKVYITDDRAVQEKMIADYNIYIQYCCETLNDSFNGCTIENVSPGLYKLEGNQWKEREPIKIKFI